MGDARRFGRRDRMIRLSIISGEKLVRLNQWGWG